MKKFTLVCVALCALMVIPIGEAVAASAEKQSLSDVEAVRKKLYKKKNRHEITPVFWMSTNDAFFQNYLAGLSYGYHLTSWLSLGVTGGYFFQQRTGLTNTLERPEKEGGFDVTPDVRRTVFLGGAEVRLSPIYGKLNALSEAVVHFDLFALLTGGVVMTTRRPLDPPEGYNDALDENAISIFAGGGVGQRYFMPMKWLAFRWEFKVLWYREELRRKGDEANTRDRLDMSISLGFSFFL